MTASATGAPEPTSVAPAGGACAFRAAPAPPHYNVGMRWIIGLAAAVMAAAQGTTPKPSAADYPVHTEADSVPIGAEYMVHSFGTGEQMYVATNYLVVEVALYRAKEIEQPLDISQFALHINGKKVGIMPQQPSMVAASLNHPEWRQRPAMDVGAGPVGVGVGYPPNRPPFPGAPQPRYPTPPRAPDAGAPGGLEKPKASTAEEVLAQTALPTEPRRGAISGFLYFPYSGKTNSIKSLVLTWMGSALKLR